MAEITKIRYSKTNQDDDTDIIKILESEEFESVSQNQSSWNMMQQELAELEALENSHNDYMNDSCFDLVIQKLREQLKELQSKSITSTIPEEKNKYLTQIQIIENEIVQKYKDNLKTRTEQLQKALATGNFDHGQTKESVEEELQKRADNPRDREDVLKIINNENKYRKLNTNIEQRYEALDVLAGLDYKQISSIKEAYDKVKDNPEQLKAFKSLTSLMIETSSAQWQENNGINVSSLETSENGVFLKLKNLGGSGLNIAFNDKSSFTITNDGNITEHQFYTFAKFFKDNGLEINDYADVNNIKVVDNDGSELGSFEELHKQYLDNSAYENKTLKELQEELFNKDGYNEYLDNIEKLDAVSKQLESNPNDPKLQAELNKLREQIDCFYPALQDAIETKQIEEEFNSNRVVEIEASDNTKNDRVNGNNRNGEYNGSSDTDLDNEDSDELGDGQTSFSSYLPDRKKTTSISKAEKALLARAGIMRINKKCIKKRRMPDGSLVIAFYDSESDLRNDGKLDKDGIAKNTKKVAFRLYNKTPSVVGIYVPQGKKFETAYAKGALKALKNQGYDYFVMPNAMEFGGDAQGAFWEAAGDQLVCPRLKRGPDDEKGCDMGNDHLTKLLKAIQDKNDGNEDGKWLYKMRLVEEINAYQAWKDPKNKNNALCDTAAGLTGDIKFHLWSSSILPNIDKQIQKGIDKEGWNAIDISCAYVAQKKIAEAIHKGVLSYTDENGQQVRIPVDYINGNSDTINKMFKAEMRAAEATVVQEFKKRCKPGCADTPSDDDSTIEDDDQNQGQNLKPKDFENASKALVTYFRESTEARFKDICSKYPGSEYAKEWKVKRVTSPRAVRMGENNCWSNTHGNANRRNGQETQQRER